MRGRHSLLDYWPAISISTRFSVSRILIYPYQPRATRDNWPVSLRALLLSRLASCRECGYGSCRSIFSTANMNRNNAVQQTLRICCGLSALLCFCPLVNLPDWRAMRRLPWRNRKLSVCVQLLLLMLWRLKLIMRRTEIQCLYSSLDLKVLLIVYFYGTEVLTTCRDHAAPLSLATPSCLSRSTLSYHLEACQYSYYQLTMGVPVGLRYTYCPIRQHFAQ